MTTHYVIDDELPRTFPKAADPRPAQVYHPVRDVPAEFSSRIPAAEIDGLPLGEALAVLSELYDRVRPPDEGSRDRPIICWGPRDLDPAMESPVEYEP